MVHVHNHLTEIQANSCTDNMLLSGIVSLVEPVEDVFPGVFIHAYAIVDDLQSGLTVGIGQSHVDAAALTTELKGIRQQVGDDLVEQVWVNPYFFLFIVS